MDHISIVEDKGETEEYVDSRSISILHDINPNSIETLSSSSYNNRQTHLSDILIKDSNRFYKKNRAKFFENAIIIRGQSNTIEMDNTVSFDEIQRHSKSQEDKITNSLSLVKKKNIFKPKTKEQIEAENQRIAKILDTKHLRLRNMSAKKSNFEDESNLESDLDVDDELEEVLSENDDGSGKYEGISKTNSLLKKYINRTESVRSRKSLLNSMFNQALYNQEKSKKFQVNSIEKNLSSSNAVMRPRPKTAVSYKDEAENRRSARSTKSEQINRYFKNMSERASKIKLYKHSQKNLKPNETEQTNSVEDAAVEDANDSESEEKDKRFQVDKESVREKSRFDFSRNYENKKHSFKLAINAYSTKVEVFKS